MAKLKLLWEYKYKGRNYEYALQTHMDAERLYVTVGEYDLMALDINNAEELWRLQDVSSLSGYQNIYSNNLITTSCLSLEDEDEDDDPNNWRCSKRDCFVIDKREGNILKKMDGYDYRIGMKQHPEKILNLNSENVFGVYDESLNLIKEHPEYRFYLDGYCGSKAIGRYYAKKQKDPLLAIYDLDQLDISQTYPNIQILNEDRNTTRQKYTIGLSQESFILYQSVDYKHHKLQAHDASNGEPIWNLDHSQTSKLSPDRTYLLDYYYPNPSNKNLKKLRCCDPKTGEVLWTGKWGGMGFQAVFKMTENHIWVFNDLEKRGREYTVYELSTGNICLEQAFKNKVWLSSSYKNKVCFVTGKRLLLYELIE